MYLTATDLARPSLYWLLFLSKSDRFVRWLIVLYYFANGAGNGNFYCGGFGILGLSFLSIFIYFIGFGMEFVKSPVDWRENLFFSFYIYPLSTRVYIRLDFNIRNIKTLEFVINLFSAYLYLNGKILEILCWFQAG